MAQAMAPQATVVVYMGLYPDDVLAAMRRRSGAAAPDELVLVLERHQRKRRHGPGPGRGSGPVLFPGFRRPGRLRGWASSIFPTSPGGTNYVNVASSTCADQVDRHGGGRDPATEHDRRHRPTCPERHLVPGSSTAATTAWAAAAASSARACRCPCSSWASPTPPTGPRRSCTQPARCERRGRRNRPLLHPAPGRPRRSGASAAPAPRLRSGRASWPWPTSRPR